MPANSAPPLPTFGEALRYWLKLGCISFGGPAGQIALMQAELVERRRWIAPGRFLHALNYCMVLPGPEAQQLATYLGWLLHGVRGGIAAGLLFVLPSFLLLVSLSWAYMTLGPTVSTQWLYGVKPAVVAVVWFSAWRVGRTALHRPTLWLVMLASLGAIAAGLGYPLVIAAAGLAGALMKRGDAAMAANGAGVNENSLTTPQEPFRIRPLLAMVAIGALLGFGGLLLLRVFSPPLLAEIAAFFGRAAFITFGGAYAVLPYVFDHAVEQARWLTAGQMLDGLALGESTPGPLIMVVSYIGFVAGWTHAGAAAPLVLALSASAVATFFTFLPSFLFILIGAPFVERTRHWQRLTAALQGVSAAVVAAILFLALRLSGQVLLPAAGVDWLALGIALATLGLLWRGWLGIAPAIGLAAVVGVAAKMLL